MSETEYSMGYGEGYESGANDIHKLMRRIEQLEKFLLAIKIDDPYWRQKRDSFGWGYTLD